MTTVLPVRGAPVAAPAVSVLVVEAQGAAATELADILTRHGYDVRTALTSQAALDAEPADVVVINPTLIDLDGWEVVRWMRSRPVMKQSFYIALTTCGRPEDLQRSKEVGIDLHLVKPVEPAVLVGVLSRFARMLKPGVTSSS